MKSIAAVVDNLGPSQLSYCLVKEFNNLIKNVDYSPVCFYNNLTAPVTTPFFGCMNIASLSTFKGAVIATSIETANLILKTASALDRYLYLWDLEWLRKPIDFESMVQIINNPQLKILTRSKDHQALLENYSNKTVHGIVDDWNINDLTGAIWTQTK